MIVASGFLVIDVQYRDAVVEELNKRRVEVHGVKEEKIVFVADGENAGELKERMDHLQSIEGVQGVYLTYFTLDDGPGKSPDDPK